MKRFIARIAANILGIYLSVSLLYGFQFSHDWLAFTIAGVILAVINVVIKPILVVLALPAVILSLGLFMVVINGALIYITHAIYPHFELNSFGAAMLAGIIISLLNYTVTKFNET